MVSSAWSDTAPSKDASGKGKRFARASDDSEHSVTRPDCDLAQEVAHQPVGRVERCSLLAAHAAALDAAGDIDRSATLREAMCLAMYAWSLPIPGSTSEDFEYW